MSGTCAASSTCAFPSLPRALRPVDSRGRSIVIDYNVPVECAGVFVRSGDIIFADVDGVAVIPQAVAELTLARAREKVQQEDASRAELERGGYLRDVYARYGVL